MSDSKPRPTRTVNSFTYSGRETEGDGGGRRERPWVRENDGSVWTAELFRDFDDWERRDGWFYIGGCQRQVSTLGHSMDIM